MKIQLFLRFRAEALLDSRRSKSCQGRPKATPRAAPFHATSGLRAAKSYQKGRPGGPREVQERPRRAPGRSKSAPGGHEAGAAQKQERPKEAQSAQERPKRAKSALERRGRPNNSQEWPRSGPGAGGGERPKSAPDPLEKSVFCHGSHPLLPKILGTVGMKAMPETIVSFDSQSGIPRLGLSELPGREKIPAPNGKHNGSADEPRTKISDRFLRWGGPLRVPQLEEGTA